MSPWVHHAFTSVQINFLTLVSFTEFFVPTAHYNPTVLCFSYRSVFVKAIVTLWLYSSAKPDLGILSDFKMEHFSTTDNGLHYDAPFDFLKRFWSFELLFAQMGFGLITKMIKILSKSCIQNHVKHLRRNFLYI